MPQDPAITWVQGQPFRPTLQHSMSDPYSLREAAALQQLLANNLYPQQKFSPGAYLPTALGGPAPPMFANQFHPPESYPNDLAAAQMMANQHTSQYIGTPVAGGSGPTSSTAAVGQNPSNGSGPSTNNGKLGPYKTSLCRSWEERGYCRYGSKCRFAGLWRESRHRKYKTEICRVRLIVTLFTTSANGLLDFLGFWILPLRYTVQLHPSQKSWWWGTRP
jgi:hypothetical protein